MTVLLALVTLSQQGSAIGGVLASIAQAPRVEVLLLPTMEEEMHFALQDPPGPPTPVVRQILNRGDVRLRAVQDALVRGYAPKAKKKNLLCAFHPDVLIRPPVGDQLLLCFHCHEGKIVGRTTGDEINPPNTRSLGSWDVLHASELESTIAKIFPDKKFPRS